MSEDDWTFDIFKEGKKCLEMLAALRALPSPAAPLEALREIRDNAQFHIGASGPDAKMGAVWVRTVAERGLTGAARSPSSTAPSEGKEKGPGECKEHSPYYPRKSCEPCQAFKGAPGSPYYEAPGEKGKEEGGPVATLPEASPRDPKLKVQRFKISPELVDGQHWSFCNTIEDLVEVIRGWHENEPMKGDDFSVEVIEMSDEEFNAMPEI